MKGKDKSFHESIDDPSNEPIDEPFNDVIDHFNKIEGNAGKPSNADLGKLQTIEILRIFYYCFLFHNDYYIGYFKY